VANVECTSRWNGSDLYPFLKSVKTQEDTKMANENELNKTNNELLIDEFEIIELEDRLELAGRCNGRCDSPVKPA
jgi:hypothetical protein